MGNQTANRRTKNKQYIILGEDEHIILFGVSSKRLIVDPKSRAEVSALDIFRGIGDNLVI